MENNAYSIKESNMLDLADYQKTLWESPRLTTLFFELTDCCNLNCKHCGSSCDASNKIYLDTQIIKKVLSSVADKYDASNFAFSICF